MTSEATETLNKILSKIPKRSEFVISYFMHDIGIDETNGNNQQIACDIDEFLIEEGFAEDTAGISNILSAGNWKSRTLLLLDKGRKLKETGSIDVFNKIEASDRRKEILRDQRESRAYYIQLFLMIWTGIAALYYLLQIFDYCYQHCLNWIYIAYFLSGLAIGLLTWLVVTQSRRLLHKSK